MKRGAALLLALCLSVYGMAGQVQAENGGQQNTGDRETIAKTQELILAAVPGTEDLTVTCRGTGAEYGVRVLEEELGDAKGPIRLKLLSLVTGSYYDLELKKETEFYTASEELEKECQTTRIDNGLRLEYRLKNGLSFALEALLEGDRCKLRIPMDSIRETERFVFTQFSLAPNLFSARADSEGYLLIPDGCGALMMFNNGKSGIYDVPVYGNNKAFLYEAYAVSREEIALPVFGIHRDGQSALAVISQGAAQARIRAATNGNETIRNRVYPVFRLREQDEQHIAEDVFQTVIQGETGIASDLEVTYLFGEDGGGYSEMASMLRSYFMDQGMKQNASQDTSVLLSIYGAVQGKQKLFGIPLYDKAIEITSCEEAGHMAVQIGEILQRPPMVRLAAWDENTVKGYGVGSFQPVGGSRSLRELIRGLEEQNISVFLSEPFARVQRSGKGIRLKKHAVRSLANELSVQYSYYRSSNSANQEKPVHYFLDGSLIPERARQLCGSLKDYGIAGIGVEDLAQISYGNYRKGSLSSPDTTEKQFAQAMSLLAEEYSLLVEGGYYQGLKEGSVVYNAPDQSSGFDFADCEVPFYQMALSGLKGYAQEAVNREENRRSALLFALETGSLLHYELAGETAQLQGTELEQLYGADWSRNQERIQEELAEFAPLLDEIIGSPIVRHEILAEHVTRTWYENGYVVTVNRGAIPAVIEGAELEAWGYRVERGDEG